MGRVLPLGLAVAELATPCAPRLPVHSSLMQSYRTVYRVEFLSPRAPREWPLEAFSRAIDHLLADEVLARNAAKESSPVSIALTEGISMADGAKPLSREYVLRHTAALPVDDPAVLQAALSDLLGVTPRQFEGPWNIVTIEVGPDTKKKATK